MIENIKKYGPRGLISGVIYGFGLVLGGMLSGFLFSIVTLERIAHLEDAVRLIIGLLFAFVITGLGGAVSGFLGGYSLPLIDQSKGRWGNAWRSAISIGIPFGLSLYPIILVFSIIALFTEDAPASTISTGVMLVGAAFGLLASFVDGVPGHRQARLCLTSLGRGAWFWAWGCDSRFWIVGLRDFDTQWRH